MAIQYRKAKHVLIQLSPVFYFLLMLFLYLAALNIDFFTDEIDVFMGGYSISKGRDIYASFISQHMPFSYYIAAIPALLGVRTVTQFRLAFYIMMSLLWTAAYLHHRKRIHPLVLWLTPVFYISQLWWIYQGSYMLSDHWQGIGMVLILLELLEYIQTWTIPVSSCVFLSLGIMLSFGTAFISAYALFVFFLGVAALQLWHGYKNQRAKIPEPSLAKRTWREDIRLVLICLVPFALLGGWYLISGNLVRFYDGAYRLNTEMYSKYTGGLGSSASGVIADTFNYFRTEVEASFSGILTDGVPGIWALLRILAMAICAVGLGIHNPIAGMTVLLATIFAGVRGYTNFHGMAFVALASAEMGLCLNWVYLRLRGRMRAAGVVVICALMAAAAFPLAPVAMTNMMTPHILDAWRPTDYDVYLEAITEPGDTIFACGGYFYFEPIMSTETIMEDVGQAVTNPWFYEMYGEEAMEILAQRKPKYIFYDENGIIWGMKYTDYAPDFNEYVQEHYTRVHGDLMVRNENMPEYRLLIWEYFGKLGTVIGGYDDRLPAGRTGDKASEKVEAYSRMLEKGETIGQTFIAAGRETRAVYLSMSTYHDRHPGGLTVRIVDPQSGEVLAEGRVKRQDILDNDAFKIRMKAALTTGKQYLIEVQTDNTGRKTYLSPQVTPEGTATEETHAVINGEAQSFSLWTRVDYAYDPETLEIMK